SNCQANKAHDDFLQLMLKNPNSKLFTEEFITAQGLSFLFGALEAPGSLFSFCGYMLATFPEVQEKLRAEADTVFAQGSIANTEELDYDAVLLNCNYLDMF